MGRNEEPAERRWVGYRWPVDELLRLLDDARAEERGASRRRERFLLQAATEGARMVGTLVDLAETARPVVVRTSPGRILQGVVRLVAADFCVLATGQSGDVWISLSAITTVRPGDGGRHGPAIGDRPAVDLLLVEALGRVVPERPRVSMVLDGGDSVSGELRSVGEDVASLRLDGARENVCYVSVPAVRLVLRSG